MAGDDYLIQTYAPLGVYAGYLSLLGAGATLPPGGFTIVPGWQLTGVAAGHSASMNTGGGGTVPTSAFGATPQPAAPPTGTGDCFVWINCLSGTYPACTVTISYVVTASGATVDGSGHFNVNCYLSPIPSGISATSNPLLTLINTTGFAVTTSFSNVGVGAKQTVTATFTIPSTFLGGGGGFLLFQTACVVDTPSSNANATITIIDDPACKINFSQALAVQPIGRIDVEVQAYTGLTNNHTYGIPVDAGDAVVAYILVANINADVTMTFVDTNGAGGSSANTWTATVQNAPVDFSEHRVWAWACENVQAATALNVVFTCSDPPADSGTIVEFHSIVMRAPGQAPGAITLGATGTGQSTNPPVGSQTGTTDAPIVRTKTNGLEFTLGTMQQGNGVPIDGSDVIQEIAANNKLSMQFFAAAGSNTPTWMQGAGAVMGWGIVSQVFFGPASIAPLLVAGSTGGQSLARGLVTNAVTPVTPLLVKGSTGGQALVMGLVTPKADMTSQVVLDYLVTQTGTIPQATLIGLLQSIPIPTAYLTTIGVRVISDVTSAGPPIRRRITLGFLPLTPATITAQLQVAGGSGSRVAGFNVSAAGSGYVMPPIVRAPGGTVPAPIATGRALLKVGAASIVTGGAGYSSQTFAQFFGGLPPYTKAAPTAVQPGQTSGASPIVRSTQSFQRLFSIGVNSAGANYVQAQVLLSGGLAPHPYGVAGRASATIRSGRIVSVNVLAQGDFYVQPPTVTIIDPTGSGSGATAAVTDMVDGSTIQLAGVPATATLTIGGGVITGVTLTSPGSGYVGVPTLYAIDPTGGGLGAVFNLSMGVGAVEVLQPGFGFASVPDVEVTPVFKSYFPEGTDQAAPFAQLMTSGLSAAMRGIVQAAYPVVS